MIIEPEGKCVQSPVGTERATSFISGVFESLSLSAAKTTPPPYSSGFPNWLQIRISKGYVGASQMALVVKDPPVNTGDIRDLGLIPGSGKFPGGGNGNPLQYSCLGNLVDRGATVHRVSRGQTRLKHLNMHAFKGCVCPL